MKDDARNFKKLQEEKEKFLRQLLTFSGIEGERLRCKWVSSAEGPEFFDCSGLVCAVFERPRTTAQGLYNTSELFNDINQVKVGDIVYFDYDPNNKKDKRPIDHVGIISKKEGNKLWMIHASGDQKCTKAVIEKYKNKKKCKVKEVRFSNYWKRKVAGFGRFKHYEY